jgi:UDP-galactopyranose mutase
VHEKTTLVYEYPQSEGDPYYPVPTPDNAAQYARYRALADGTPEVRFVGRLASYRYYNMDQVVAQALTVARKIVESEGELARSGRRTGPPKTMDGLVERPGAPTTSPD